MEYQNDSYQNSISPSEVISYVEEIRDTELGHLDMAEFLRRVETSIEEEIAPIIQSHILMVSTFLVASLESKFVMVYAKNFDYESRIIRDHDGNTIISLYPDTTNRIFKVPHVHVAINMEKALKRWNKGKMNCIQYINDNSLVNKRASLMRWPKAIHRSDFKEDINDLFTLLNMIGGLRESNTFETWMYKFISLIMRSKHNIFWGELISDILCERLSH